MKKKTLSFLLAVSCALSLLLSGCGQNQQPAPDDTQPGVQDQQPEQTPEPTLREPEIDQTREIVFAASRDQCQIGRAHV